jgi:hypothetical protein
MPKHRHYVKKLAHADSCGVLSPEELQYFDENGDLVFIQNNEDEYGNDAG